jgi:hypothetical protein
VIFGLQHVLAMFSGTVFIRKSEKNTYFRMLPSLIFGDIWFINSDANGL